MPAWFPSFPLEVAVTQPGAGAIGWGGGCSRGVRGTAGVVPRRIRAQPASAGASGTTDQV
jgi:hypothetical protein